MYLVEDKCKYFLRLRIKILFNIILACKLMAYDVKYPIYMEIFILLDLNILDWSIIK